ncbi:MAG: MoaD/ThiS family protein [Coxiellaceae bacterium]|nr:MAG: MoaD/ThiS family protein [Coxiellaceae bacterium]
MATIVLSTTLVACVEQQDHLTIAGGTLFAILIRMINRYPALRQRLFAPNGNLTDQWNVYLNDEDVPLQHWQHIMVQPSDKIHILYAGGRSYCPNN